MKLNKQSVSLSTLQELWRLDNNAFPLTCGNKMKNIFYTRTFILVSFRVFKGDSCKMRNNKRSISLVEQETSESFKLK